ncbi:MAG: chemotaxis protein CheA [Xanthobacteraceae bacterium]|nr:chemotaxis protein CheA [Xanthobacteraceae bacterium]QYK44172.1 MAG: chemotaxis protein CheA [Xanthobacteraceae bacterium]
MSKFDDLKHTFFDECDEALQQIEAGLTAVRDGDEANETIHAIFRAVHSVKGGAGIFGFEALVGFAHAFETVLDKLRHGTLANSVETLDVLLSANDVLSDLIRFSRSGETIAPDFGQACRKMLDAIAGIDADGADGGVAPADFDGIDFTPVMASADEPEQPQPLTFFIMPRSPDMPLLPLARVFDALRGIGELDLVADTSALPPTDKIVQNEVYISWQATLHSAASREEVEALLQPIAGLCDIGMQGGAVASFVQETAPQVEPLQPVVPDVLAEPSKTATSHKMETPAEAKTTSPPRATATTTRVELEKIDRVVNLVGELVIAQAMLGQIVNELPEHTSARLTQSVQEVIHHTRELKDSVMSMRAQPVGSVFQRMPRLVRELSAKTGKKVRLELAGEKTEVDRSIIERLGDPLTHIIRNSVDHGIERPDARVAAGKQEEGTVRLSAEHRGGRIVIEIRDDGAGIDPERVLRKAQERGLVKTGAQLGDDEINNLIMLPGFSTAETVSDISGRGVGMDVVRSNIAEIGGRVSLKSERGRGMTIQLSLPLTLAVMEGMVIKSAGEIYVMPLSAIVECLLPDRSVIGNLVGTQGVLQLRGEHVPLLKLGEVFALRKKPDADSDKVVIVTDAGDGNRIGLVVDELCGHQQVVIKSIEESYGAVPGIAAATILGNGRVAFILDAEKLTDLAARTQMPARAA